jgi:hypothetical protein
VFESVKIFGRPDSSNHEFRNTGIDETQQLKRGLSRQSRQYELT